MLKKRLLIFLIVSNVVSAQIVHEAEYKSIYNFLERMSLSGIINYQGEIKPISRLDICSYLIDVKAKRSALSILENEELDFYLEEYSDELSLREDFNKTIEKEIQFLRRDSYNRFRFFHYSDSLFRINIDPILGYSLNVHGGKSQNHRWNGLDIYGYITKEIGFRLAFRDNEEWDEFWDQQKEFSENTGVSIIKRRENSIEYSEVEAAFNYSWGWGNLTFGKEFLTWGSGHSGQLILSHKAPSFPLVRLDVSPAAWLRFSYIHGWLHSRLRDPSLSRKILVDSSFSQIEKFIAAHILSVDLNKYFTISLGESVIYSDNLEPIYFIPIIFLRMADHYLHDKKNNSNTGDNAQLFANLVYANNPLETKFYSTVFIDEFSLTGFLKGEDYASAIGYTIGFSSANTLIKNSQLTFEYTKIEPFVYMNANEVQYYSSHGYQLGHWIGSNADQIYIEYNQKVLRGLSFILQAEYIRKGKKELPEEQYELPYPSFLYGEKLRMQKYKIELSYEFIHQLFAKASYEYSYITDEDTDRTPSWQMGKKNSFGFSIYYGL